MDEPCLRAFLEARYQRRDLSSHLDRESFCSLFREAVTDYFPSFIRRQADQGVYGISFEIGNVVQKVYAENFRTYLYFNTESACQEASEGEDPEELAETYRIMDAGCHSSEYEDFLRLL